MQSQMPPNQNWYGQLRGLRNGFIAGLLIGMLIGWFFHGLVGLAVRFGFVLALLIPLAIVVWFFFLRGRGGTPARDSGVQVFTWGTGQDGQRYRADPRQQQSDPAARRERSKRQPDESEIIDLEFEELKRDFDGEERRS